MDVGGRATHDCKDAGDRMTQEIKSRSSCRESLNASKIKKYELADVAELGETRARSVERLTGVRPAML